MLCLNIFTALGACSSSETEEEEVCLLCLVFVIVWMNFFSLIIPYCCDKPDSDILLSLSGFLSDAVEDGGEEDRGVF